MEVIRFIIKCLNVMFSLSFFLIFFITVEIFFDEEKGMSLKLLDKKPEKLPKITFWHFVRHPGTQFYLFHNNIHWECYNKQTSKMNNW